MVRLYLEDNSDRLGMDPMKDRHQWAWVMKIHPHKCIRPHIHPSVASCWNHHNTVQHYSSYMHHCYSDQVSDCSDRVDMEVQLCHYPHSSDLLDMCLLWSCHYPGMLNQQDSCSMLHVHNPDYMCLVGTA